MHLAIELGAHQQGAHHVDDADDATNVSASTTGRWRIPLAVINSMTSSTLLSGVQVMTELLIARPSGMSR